MCTHKFFRARIALEMASEDAQAHSKANTDETQVYSKPSLIRLNSVQNSFWSD